MFRTTRYIINTPRCNSSVVVGRLPLPLPLPLLPQPLLATTSTSHFSTTTTTLVTKTPSSHFTTTTSSHLLPLPQPHHSNRYSYLNYSTTNINNSNDRTNYNNNNNSNNNNNNSNKDNKDNNNKKNGNGGYKVMVPLLAAGFAIPLCILAVNGNGTTPPNVDVQKIYANKSTSELIFNYVILKICSMKILSDNGLFIIETAQKLGLSRPLYWVVRNTFFKQFCAGETIEETEEFTNRLNLQGIGTILDYSVEDSEGSPESFDHVATMIKRTIAMAAKHPEKSFSCVKVTGLTNPKLLEKLNTIIAAHPKYTAELLRDPMAVYSQAGTLSQAELVELQQLVSRLDSIFSECYRTNVPVLVDAEQTYYQAAIHHLAMAFSVKYNTNRPLIYNTYQMYLVQGLDTLKDHMGLSKEQSFHLGAKLVRGAYMSSERKRALELGLADPIQPTIQETHHNYFTAMELLLKESPNVGVMFATHNEQSIQFGVDRIKQLNLDPANPNLQFGQLFGMADFLSFGLASQHQRVFKYVPFGPVQETLPYLVRRMQENRGFVGSNSAIETGLLMKEIKRRLSIF
ncbi:hypothetical protein SAMD00019534_090430 [Acytostelium subglobosum LB1]|uniref:hypothetical protein n=1 Tax=Acytostelium subglobosum LB1 TaxID=1410327 RepID=UPI000644D354|nr:hypothetical protein SAMD00019534_090430 [Acytostelium subglobosum LB1]GAM25868.1 hypothetical protein SAMD00019534_090430 [Acytostelium subglobosum LB1]|eukprot:XP_012751386.1 hypothetical protein SAMD00019534_090430 [Acytostelium subglobosum LB1]